MLQRWLLEFDVDEVLLECYSLPVRATGRLGLIGPWPADTRWTARQPSPQSS